MKMDRIPPGVYIHVSRDEYEYIRYNGFCNICMGYCEVCDNCPMDGAELVIMLIEAKDAGGIDR